MQERARLKPKDVIEQLRKGKMLDHPGIALHVRRALDTNDYSPLMEYLASYPSILAIARNKIAKEEFENSLSPFRPYPTEEEVNEHLSGPLKLGYVNRVKSIFGILWDILCLPILIAGRTGSGKSSLIKSIINQIVTIKLPFNILIPDLKKEYRHLCTPDTNLKVLMRDKIMINPLQVPSWCTHITDYIVAFAKSFVSENYLLGTSENFIIDLVDELYRQRGVYDGTRNYPTFKDLYDLVGRYLTKKQSFRYTDVFLWIQNRLKPYLLSDSFQCQVGIPFEIFQRENLAIEMDTGFTDRMYNFTIATIANQLYMHNKAKDIGGAIKHWFVIDEARILFNAHRDVSEFGESILNEILTKSRAYGISFLLASQESASFNSVMRALSFLKIAFPLNDAIDLDFIQGSFGLSDEQTQALFELPPYGTAVVRYGGYTKPFLLEVPYFEITKKVSDVELKDRMSSFYAELDQYIRKAVPSVVSEPDTDSEPTTNIPAAAAALLFFLGKYPFTTITGLNEVSGFKSPDQVKKALEWLIHNEYIKIEKYRTSRTKPSTYTILMDKALAYLDMDGIPGKGSFEHSLYQHLIITKLIRDGYKAKIEDRMERSKKMIDVLAESPDKRFIAFEITLSFSNIITNIIEDLRAGVAEVVVVCRNKEDLSKAVEMIASAKLPAQIHDRIKCELIDAFFS